MTITRLVISIGLFYWLQLIHFDVVNAFYTSQSSQPIGSRHYHNIVSPHSLQQQHHSSSILYGISEWRAKFSTATAPPSSQTTTTSDQNNNSKNLDSNTPTLPLLLLPFTPTQILLPGQSTTLKFRHGKYMDIIDESLTSYESVVGMSILDEDGLLPHVVICEVLEEEMELNMGYRGFSSMEVGVRAVGRARRITETATPRTMIQGIDDVVGGRGKKRTSSSVSSSSFHGRTALDDIHLGQFVEWQDDALNGDEQFEIASEYLENIEGLLMLPSSSSRQQISGGGGTSSRSSSNNNNPSDLVNDRIKHQQMLFHKAYETTLNQHSTDVAASLRYSATTTTSTSYSNNQQREHHARLMAFSWATFAAAAFAQENNNDDDDDAVRSSSSSIITQALATKDTVERLRLGLAMMLESQMPSSSCYQNGGVDGGTTVGGRKKKLGYYNSGDEQDDVFQ
ncbi:hypothetical protein ACHAXR_002009 [Thalassiosira sp. AJA248-18]